MLYACPGAYTEELDVICMSRGVYETSKHPHMRELQSGGLDLNPRA